MKFYLGLNGEPITSRVSDVFRGVGLIRGEYICRRENAYVTAVRCQEAIRDYCERIATLFAPDPVWYRFVEMETSELNLLPGVDHRLQEKTTMLGLRGARRAVSYLDTFEMEAAAVIAAARRSPNLHVLLPFVHDVGQVEVLAKALSRWGFGNRMGMMAEIPSAVLTLGDYFSAGISNVTVGMNDLTSLTLGTERRSSSYKLLHPAVLRLVGMALETAAANGVTVMIAGYLTREIMSALEGLGCENLILHYSTLAQLLPAEFSSLPHTLDLDEMKTEIRRRVAASVAVEETGRRLTAPSPAPSQQNGDYMRALAAALAREMEDVGCWCPPVRELLDECRRLESTIQGVSLDVRFEDWQRARADYHELGLAVAARLNEAACIARSYGSMDEFWADAGAQATGLSPHTFWDTYEHGRRRQLERTIAEVYGAEDALLLNAGMSAVTAAIEAADLRPGDRIVTGLRNYFETAEYLDVHLSKRGIEILRAPIDQADAMQAVIARSRPRLVLFETATNSPDTAAPQRLEAWLRESPESLFVCDNTVQGTLTGWFSDPALRAILPERFLVVESATKYLSQSVMAGLVYGKRDLVHRARALARVTGQQLQEKAFNYLRAGDLLHVGQRLKLHSRNIGVFAEQLFRVRKSCFSVRLLNGAPRQRHDGSGLFAEGVGGLVFLVPGGDRAPQKICRQLLSSWQRRVGAMGYSLPVRAGFGWSETSARIYETDALNQSDAPAYLRISVGIEPEDVARKLGTSLCEALEEVS